VVQSPDMIGRRAKLTFWLSIRFRDHDRPIIIPIEPST
jgi:hypothetical protein